MIRLALCLALLLAPGLAAAESLRDALIGSWARVESNQLSDAATVTAAQAACARPGFGSGSGVVLASANGRFSLDAWDDGAAEAHWDFDAEVHGGRLDDGRMVIRFAVDGTPTHELTFWRISVGGAEQSLLDVLGPGLAPAIYLKCPS